MTNINKFLLGLRPASKMFRISSIGGTLIDAVLSERGESLGDEYYTEVSSNFEQGALLLKNEELGNYLKIDPNNIILIKDGYKTKEQLNTDKMVSEFLKIWKTINSILKVKDIRRIGIVAEHQSQTQESNINKKLLESYTTI